LPSFGETFGIVLLEAMLYSTPIISGDSWGPNEIIKNEFNGIKVSISDNEKTPKLIADAVEKLVNDEKLAKELAENAYQEFFKKYTTGEVINYLEEICKKVVKMGKE
jgi:glycosyltransferase involved in cell wall biosynthesis